MGITALFSLHTIEEVPLSHEDNDLATPTNPAASTGKDVARVGKWRDSDGWS